MMLGTNNNILENKSKMFSLLSIKKYDNVFFKYNIIVSVLPRCSGG